MKKSFLFILYFILNSCKSEFNEFNLEGTSVLISIDAVNNSKEVNAEIIQEISDSLFRATNLFQMDNRYIAIGDIGAKRAFHLFDPITKRYMGNFGPKGFGPGEVQVVWKFYQPESGTLGAYDIDQRKLVEYCLDSLLSNSGNPREIKLATGLNSNGVIRWEDKLYFIDSNNSVGRLYSSNVDEPGRKAFGTLPNLNKYYPSLTQGELIEKVGFAKLVRGGAVFAMASYNLPLLQVFNSEEGKWLSIFGPDEFPLPNKFGETVYYGSVYVSEKFIYGLYFGRDDTFDNPSKLILVFDHKGELIKKINLNLGIFEFIVQNDDIIWGLTRNVNNLNYALVKFQLD